MAAQEQQFGLARVDYGQHQADVLLFLGGGADLLGRGNRPDQSEQPLIPAASRAAAQFVQTRAYSGPVQPALGVFAVSLRVPPQLQKDLNREFLRACGVLDHPRNDAGDALAG